MSLEPHWPSALKLRVSGSLEGGVGRGTRGGRVGPLSGADEGESMAPLGSALGWFGFQGRRVFLVSSVRVEAAVGSFHFT